MMRYIRRMIYAVSIVFVVIIWVDSFTNKHNSKYQKWKQFSIGLINYLILLLALFLISFGVSVLLTYLTPVVFNVFMNQIFQVATIAVSGTAAILLSRKWST